jgi:8-oxo-dGTP diphosphatase
MDNKHGFFQITQKLFLRKDNFLLVMKDRKSQCGDLPGGRLHQDEFFENWLHSLERELIEEMGDRAIIEVFPEPIFIAKHNVQEGNHPCVIVAYQGLWKGGEIILSEEHDYMEWVDVNTYKPSPLFKDYMLKAVEKYLGKHK